MRTTVNIDDELLRRARQRASAREVSLGHVVDDALRLYLTAPNAVGSPVVLPTRPRPSSAPCCRRRATAPSRAWSTGLSPS